MKAKIIQLSLLMAVIGFAIGCGNQAPKQEAAENKTEAATAVASNEEMIVEAACGECQFGLEGSDCELAVRIDGQAYFVDGANIDDYGDAHAADGFCSTVRKAKVKGAIENGRFVVESFELIAQSDIQNPNQNQ